MQVRAPQESIQANVPPTGTTPRASDGAASDTRSAVRRVWAVIPCHNRPEDLRLLLADLDRCELPAGYGLTITVVDNASTIPISIPQHARFEHHLLRLADNTGGAGGFNAGIASIMHHTHEEDFIWLLDSDARIDPETLNPLVQALESDATLVAAGSALCDPATGEIFEVGGRLHESHGEYEQPAPAERKPLAPVEAQYLAACSLLVRRWAIDRAGLLPDIFLNGDDVEWTMRLSRRTGGRLVCVPSSRARHPRPDRMRTWQRYYGARNAFVALAEAPQAGAIMRWKRAWREVARAISQALIGRDDLAKLHLLGLADAASGRVRGRGFPALPPCETGRPIDQLPEAIQKLETTPRFGAGLEPAIRHRMEALLTQSNVPFDREAASASAGGPMRAVSQLFGAMIRLAIGTAPRVTIVSSRSRAADWLAGRTIISVSQEHDRFWVEPAGLLGRGRAVTGLVMRGSWHAARLAMRPLAVPLPELPRPGVGPSVASAEAVSTTSLTLSIIILSYNRWLALERTLMAIGLDEPLGRKPEVIVVDNASTDGTPIKLQTRFPDVKLIALDQNRGVEGFNIGAAQATGDVLLILDDDAEPDRGVLKKAMALLSQQRDIDAVSLHPRHPVTGRSEWPFAEQQPSRGDWPFMGCGNLVRRDAWQRVAGYDADFFLYRNDVDLAMKLLAAGGRVYFDPAWIVWHNTIPTLTKSVRWCELATRNWIWLARRHAKGRSRWIGITLGVLRAIQLAGWRPRAQLAVIRGAVAGLFHRKPPAPSTLHVDGRAFASMLRIRRDQSGVKPTPHPPKPEILPEPLQVISK